ncbi:MAG: NAD(P)-dependent oxidoreductase [Sediminibacterium sp.]|nr:NAD(P)-dependent oxidoreductase [Sediminibacterium sp.]
MVKTIFITGATRGIGRAIALALGSLGHQIVVTGKSVSEDPRLGGTIFSVAAEVKQLGGNALAIQMDVRSEEQVQSAINTAIENFGGIDVLINNASALFINKFEQTPLKKYDLIHQINVRGSFIVTQLALPYLKKGQNPHIITLAPPLNLHSKWLASYIPYTLTKYSMSLLALGWAAEFKTLGIASNTLWPKTLIATQAVNNNLGGAKTMAGCRKPEIVADAVKFMMEQPAANYTSQQLLDEDVLKSSGITDFSQYAFQPGQPLIPDIFI